MKLLRYGTRGAEKPGLLTEDGKVRDLSGVVADISPNELSPKGLQRIAAKAAAGLPEVSGAPRLGCPIAGIRQFIAIGLNYRDHAREAGLSIPEEPIVFLKAVSCIGGPDDDICIPPGATKVDWEVELGIVIGTLARCVPKADAMDHIAGYVLANDVSERGFQLERGGTWDKGKGCEGFGPLGPWLVTRDEIADPLSLSLWLDVNGARRQTGSTKDMIFGVDELVSYVSGFITLLPGDVIITGTPAGVGLGMKPPVYLKPGDVVRLGIDGLGTQTQRYR